ncbi:RING-variant domain-containing protein [Phthorimaea operculella]|nr:RING-variant domain-containing protein [Phthorimaea operculella]
MDLLNIWSSGIIKLQLERHKVQNGQLRSVPGKPNQHTGRQNEDNSPSQVFHLRDIRWERPRFLSKSFLAFVTFNLINYSLLAAEVLTTNVAGTSLEKKNFYQHVFNGCYAVLLFIVVIFFLIYGVEVYFKLRGEFLKETKVCTIIAPRPGTSSADDDARATLVKQGIETDATEGRGELDRRAVDVSQLHQSRLGLVSQALMLILIAGFLASETLSEFWKTKVPVVSRNWHDVVFRLAEIGVALWFPCVLWNSMAPERLWLLNPRRLLAKQLDDNKLHELLQQDRNVETDSLVDGSSLGGGRDCWICYDSSRAEPLIRPCRCTGDVAAVHHDCLRRWLVESSANPDGLKCKVCNTPYIVQETNRVEWERGFTWAHWARTALAVAGMVGAGGAAWLVAQLCESPVPRIATAGCALIVCYICVRQLWALKVTLALVGMKVAGGAAWLVAQLCESPVPRIATAGCALIVCYICVRFLGTNTVSAYQRAKVSSLKILTDPLDAPDPEGQKQVCTISKTVTVDIASKAVLERALKGETK